MIAYYPKVNNLQVLAPWASVILETVYWASFSLLIMLHNGYL